MRVHGTWSDGWDSLLRLDAGFFDTLIVYTWEPQRFTEAIREATGIDLAAGRDADELRSAIAERGLQISTKDATWPQLADQLLTKFVEPGLQEPTFVRDYPVELSPFAREHRSQPGLVERWEAFAGFTYLLPHRLW